MIKQGILLILILLLIGCSTNENPEPILPKNLIITVNVSTDGSGEVTVLASAEDAKFYKFYFGEDPSENPQPSEFKSALYKYQKSGTYMLKVQAHADEQNFISETKEITVDLSFPIPKTGYTTPDNYPGMNLIWQDEFNGEAIQSSKWTFEIGNGCPNCGWGNNELEYYKQENASIVDGHLVITAKSESIGGQAYTSSRMITKGKFDFKYGRIDVRAALPKGQGIWPAIWMLGSNISTVGWPKCGEIDIMEMIGGTTEREKTVFGTLHWDNAGTHACTCDKPGYVVPEGNLNDRFHVFTLTWDQTYITWYVDNVEFNKIDITPGGLSEFHENFFLILNLAVGGNWPGSPNASTKFPQYLIVDYIRVFQNQ